MCVNGTSASPGGFRGLFTRTRATFPSVERALSPFRITLNFLRTPRGSRETNETKTRLSVREGAPPSLLHPLRALGCAPYSEGTPDTHGVSTKLTLSFP